MATSTMLPLFAFQLLLTSSLWVLVRLLYSPNRDALFTFLVITRDNIFLCYLSTVKGVNNIIESAMLMQCTKTIRCSNVMAMS